MKKVIIETVALVSVVCLSYGYDFNFDKAGGSITSNEIKLDAAHIKVDRSQIPWWVSGAIILPGENRLMLSSGSGSTTINADGVVKLQINVPPNHSVSRSCGWGITDPAGKELCNVRITQEGGADNKVSPMGIADSLSEQEKDESDKDSDDEGLEGDDESAQGEVLLPDKRISDIAKFIQTTPFKDIPLEKDPGPISAAWAEMFELYQNNWNIIGRDGVEAYEQRRSHHNSIRNRLLSRLVEMNSIFANGAKTGEFEDVNNRHEFGNEYVHLLVALCANLKEGRDSSALNNFLNDFQNENDPKIVWHSNLRVVKSWLQNEKDKSVQLLKVSDANQQTPLAKLSKQQLEETLEKEKQYEERMKVDQERTMLECRRISSKAYPSKHDTSRLHYLSRRLRTIEKLIRESQKRQNAIRGQIAQCGGKVATAEDSHKGETSSKEFKFCTKCGKKASSADNFCGGCGNEF